MRRIGSMTQADLDRLLVRIRACRACAAQLPRIELTLAIGQYAQRHLLGTARKASLTETVRAWRDFGPQVIPLPHPSPRNTLRLRRQPWFAQERLPVLRARVQTVPAAAAHRHA